MVATEVKTCPRHLTMSALVKLPHGATFCYWCWLDALKEQRRI